MLSHRGPVRPVELKGRPYSKDALGRLQRQKRQHHIFVLGRDCDERVALSHLLTHWEWHIAEKVLAITSRVFDEVNALTVLLPTLHPLTTTHPLV